MALDRAALSCLSDLLDLLRDKGVAEFSDGTVSVKFAPAPGGLIDDEGDGVDPAKQLRDAYRKGVDE